MLAVLVLFLVLLVSAGGPVEFAWVGLNETVIVVSAFGFRDARRSAEAVRRLNGHGPKITARGDARREVFRIAAQFGLLLLAIPALQRPGDTAWSWQVAVLFAIALCIAANTAGDYIDRRLLIGEALRRDRRLGDRKPDR